MSSFSILFRILSKIRLNVKLLKRANRFSKKEVERERDREREKTERWPREKTAR